MVYNSYLKIMKKLFYSLIMLVAMSLTFVACDGGNTPGGNKPDKVESNCEFFAGQYSVDETGKAMYVFEFATNGLDIANGTGTGEYFVLMLYAQPGSDGFPIAKTYNHISFEELAYMEEWDECVIGGAPVSQSQIIGTFVYNIENDQATDVLLSLDGNVTIEGNQTNGTIKATIDFESAVTGDIITKEYIYSGAINLEEQVAAPAARAARAFELNK